MKKIMTVAVLLVLSFGVADAAAQSRKSPGKVWGGVALAAGGTLLLLRSADCGSGSINTQGVRVSGGPTWAMGCRATGTISGVEIDTSYPRDGLNEALFVGGLAGIAGGVLLATIWADAPDYAPSVSFAPGGVAFSKSFGW